MKPPSDEMHPFMTKSQNRKDRELREMKKDGSNP
jgi:hypothetical protein